MAMFKRILCPIDLSGNSLAAIEMATTIAKQYHSKVVFLYVAPQWLSASTVTGNEYIQEIVKNDKAAFEKITPTDASVPFEHVFINGNPGPEVVLATQNADMVVMSTHGRTGIARFMMGSVAQYVLHNAKCPVILVKGLEITKLDLESESEESKESKTESQTFVTDLMHQVPPIHSFDEMETVLEQMTKAKTTAAPVIDSLNTCIGILTQTDINDYRSLKKRFEKKDESVVDEMFEVDKYGQRRPINYNFDHVERHMTTELVSVKNTDSIQKAKELFELNPKIHHLVVLDDCDHPVGIVDASEVVAGSNDQIAADVSKPVSG